MKPEIKPVHVTDKALLYINNNRANLHYNEIVKIVQEGRWVHLGSTDIDFFLVWDHRKSHPVVLLVDRCFAQDTVVSVWGAHYRGIPGGTPNDLQVWVARSLALTPEAPTE